MQQCCLVSQRVETAEDDLAVAQRYREMFIKKTDVASSVFSWCIEYVRIQFGSVVVVGLSVVC